jgi:hypothetical protein
MRIVELLNEKQVESTWITDLIYTRPTKTLTMRLSDGKSYKIAGISRTMFDKWYKTNSKGKFFHDFIKGTYNVARTK